MRGQKLPREAQRDGQPGCELRLKPGSAARGCVALSSRHTRIRDTGASPPPRPSEWRGGACWGPGPVPVVCAACLPASLGKETNVVVGATRRPPARTLPTPDPTARTTGRQSSWRPEGAGIPALLPPQGRGVHRAAQAPVLRELSPLDAPVPVASPWSPSLPSARGRDLALARVPRYLAPLAQFKGSHRVPTPSSW